ncbi:MAG TPA: hypothetical protein VK335_04880 [Bryobacteraceae bacterium]|nr:hypothetical protein [Bryobacteraceae bacterium]
MIAALALMAMATAGLAAGNSVAGAWECVSVTPDGDELHTTLTVTEADGKLNAKLVGDDGEWTVSKVKFENNVLSFTVTRDADYEVTMTVDGDKMDGKWAGNGISGKISATRHKA